ncbi:hypothetical protein MATL_G00252410 [Megalops atlanticus]|uniref:E3 ubiquitin/ISG15 ligase TRIM25-like n=1 Tax=Megalops atlanticus TaxID=7932 RepID=A0A9D3PD15_MEGAT|nr:hypothetical protein MATL_G00252410 [Megalops atlanticus]
MAAAGDLLDREQFSCSICLDLLKDPVAIPCGHSYCMDCIKGCWDQNDQTGVYCCPQCRQTFTPRPVLGRNTILAAMVEKLKKTGLQGAPPAHSYAGPGDVACDVCTGRKLKAVESCLECLVSYCETHLQVHNEINPGKKHKLIQATSQLQEKICSHHDKLLEVYCRTDQQCICLLCVMDEHRGHDTVSSAAERTEKQKELGETQRKFQQRIQEREKELQDLRQAVESVMHSAQAAVEDSERIFTELICSIERRRSEVKDLIRDQEKAAVSQAEGVMERLEQEIAELRRTDAELEQLSHTEDHIHFLQSCQSLCVPPGCGDLLSITINPDVSFGFVTKSVSELKERLEDICKEELAKISGTVKYVHLLQVPEPSTRAEFLQYSCQLTLDPNTAQRELLLSEGNSMQCICLRCVMDEHKGHDTVSAAAERTEKQTQLGETQREFQQRIQEREKELQDLRQAVESLTHSAQAAVEDNLFNSERCSAHSTNSRAQDQSRVLTIFLPAHTGPKYSTFKPPSF